MNIVNALMDSYLDEEEVTERDCKNIDSEISNICVKLKELTDQIFTTSDLQKTLQDINKLVAELDVQRTKLTDLNNSLINSPDQEQIEDVEE
ncbi:hypothetical protein IJJ97_07350 [bacterium]|nr:hypothetical protein [bacterium]